LFLRYMDYGGAFLDFYRQGLQSLERECRSRFGRPFSGLAGDRQSALVREISAANPAGWAGPPAPLFYFVLRNDAADVCYGTPAGFAKLGIPYQAMNPPSNQW
jgi:gluconate 2-dehydrogenase gamma chain